MNKNITNYAILQNNNINLDYIKNIEIQLNNKYNTLENYFNNLYIENNKLLKLNDKLNDILINN